MKTMEQWHESRQDLGKFLQVGDVVDEEIADYFLCVLPPACMTGGIIQIGEPNSHVNGRATYATIKRTPEGWVYCGHCHRGQTVEPGVRCATCNQVLEDTFHTGVFFHVTECSGKAVA